MESRHEEFEDEKKIDAPVSHAAAETNFQPC